MVGMPVNMEPDMAPDMAPNIHAVARSVMARYRELVAN